MYQLDTGQKDLPMFFKGWQLRVLEYLWSIRPPGANSIEKLNEAVSHITRIVDESR